MVPAYGYPIRRAFKRVHAPSLVWQPLPQTTLAPHAVNKCQHAFSSGRRPLRSRRDNHTYNTADSTIDKILKRLGSFREVPLDSHSPFVQPASIIFEQDGERHVECDARSSPLVTGRIIPQQLLASFPATCQLGPASHGSWNPLQNACQLCTDCINILTSQHTP